MPEREMQQLKQEVANLEKRNKELKRTMDFMEESAETAKTTIIDLKEALAGRDLEIRELEKASHAPKIDFQKMQTEF